MDITKANCAYFRSVGHLVMCLSEITRGMSIYIIHFYILCIYTNPMEYIECNLNLRGVRRIENTGYRVLLDSPL